MDVARSALTACPVLLIVVVPLVTRVPAPVTETLALAELSLTRMLFVPITWFLIVGWEMSPLDIPLKVAPMLLVASALHPRSRVSALVLWWGMSITKAALIVTSMVKITRGPRSVPPLGFPLSDRGAGVVVVLDLVLVVGVGVVPPPLLLSTTNYPPN